MKVRWIDRKNNDKVLGQIGEDKVMLKMIVERKKHWLGHAIRHEGMLKQVIEKIEVRRRRWIRIGMINDM